MSENLFIMSPNYDIWREYNITCNPISKPRPACKNSYNEQVSFHIYLVRCATYQNSFELDFSPTPPFYSPNHLSGVIRHELSHVRRTNLILRAVGHNTQLSANNQYVTFMFTKRFTFKLITATEICASTRLITFLRAGLDTSWACTGQASRTRVSFH